MAEDSQVLACLAAEARTVYWFHYRCGSERDCIPSDNQDYFGTGFCHAQQWVNQFRTGFVEIWEPHNARKMFTVRYSDGSTSEAYQGRRGYYVPPRVAPISTAARLARCGEAGLSTARNPFAVAPGDDRFAISIPGLSDILRIPGIDTADTRRERLQRFRGSKSPLPAVLQPLVKLLNKLDDAQDMLYTVLVAAVWLFPRIAARFIPGIGWLLAINDLLNAGT
jgi:hypothetical protein